MVGYIFLAMAIGWDKIPSTDCMLCDEFLQYSSRFPNHGMS